MSVVIASLVLVTAGLTFTGADADAACTSLSAKADTYIRTSDPTLNFGTAAEARTSAQTNHSFVRFDTSSVPADATITGAVLRLYSIRAVSATTFDVHPMVDTWSETTVNANTAPPWNTTVLARSGNLLANTWMTITLPPSAIKVGGPFSLGVNATGSTDGRFATRETANAPKLELTYSTSATSPPTSSPITTTSTSSTTTSSTTSTTAPITTTTTTPGGVPAPTTKPLASRETTVLAGASGDVSDDSAIWRNPTDPAASVVIGDNKASSGGIAVYDMAGRVLQYRKDGAIGNVDLRENVNIGGRSIVLVGANNRTNNTLVFYEFDTTTRQLTPINAKAIPTVAPNYGFCLYKSPSTAKVYAFTTQASGSTLEQYELVDVAGKVDAVKVRTISVGSQSEGCVTDDELGNLYVGEEDVALWKYSAEPSGGSTRVAVGTTGDGHLRADIEGLTLTYGPNGQGYLIASSQGNSTFAVYERSGSNAFVRTFAVGGTGTVDTVSSTDGVDAKVGNFGPGFELGLLVVHDASNTGGSSSNLKYVPLQQAVVVQ